jgi:hypothetical protein
MHPVIYPIAAVIILIVVVALLAYTQKQIDEGS